MPEAEPTSARKRRRLLEEIELAGQRAAHVSFGGQGPRLHFYHANGYPPGVYAPLLERLATRFEVDALALRAMWPGIAPLPAIPVA